MTRDTPPTVVELRRDMTKRHGLPIGPMSEVADEITALSTGNLAIDYLTGCGGLPVGRVTELYGQASSGKTTTALQAAAVLQSKIISEGRDEHILYLDFEHAMDGEYAAALGLDVEHPSFLLVQPHWLEQGAEIGEKFIASGTVRLSIWDSVAEMTPRDVEFGVRTNAMERARLMNSLLQRLNSLLHEQRCAGVFLNHMVEAIEMGGRPGMPPHETSPGGKALKFYASIRLAYKQIGNKKGTIPDALSGADTEQVIATHVKVKVTKNKVGVPFREAEVRVQLGEGFSNHWSALQVLLAHRLVAKDASWYRFKDDLIRDWMTRTATRGSVHGESGVLGAARDYPEWGDQLVSTAQALIANHCDAAISPLPDDPLAAVGGE